MAGHRSVNIERFREGLIAPAVDQVAVEKALEIRLAHADWGTAARSLSITMRTGGNDAELAIGYLYNEALITTLAQIRSITTCAGGGLRVELTGPAPDLTALQRVGAVSSSCGMCGKTALPIDDHLKVLGDATIATSLLLDLPARLRAAMPTFALTGGLHGVAVFDFNGHLLAAREDVGRHNALDKLVGWALKTEQLPWTDRLLLLSGRASFELLQKASMAGASMVAAIGAPSSLAIAKAEGSGITLLGFLNGHGFNVYSHGQRVRRAFQRNAT